MPGPSVPPPPLFEKMKRYWHSVLNDLVSDAIWRSARTNPVCMSIPVVKSLISVPCAMHTLVNYPFVCNLALFQLSKVELRLQTSQSLVLELVQTSVQSRKFTSWAMTFILFTIISIIEWFVFSLQVFELVLDCSLKTVEIYINIIIYIYIIGQIKV